MAKRYDPILCMMVDEPTKAQDELSLAQKKQVVTELKGYLKKSYNFSDESEYARAYEDLRHMFTTGSRKSISGLFENTVKKTGVHDANALYETFAHGNSKHAGVLEMNGKAKVVVWNEGDNPRTGKVTVIGEDTPANRSKAKSMLDSAKAKDSNALDAKSLGKYKLPNGEIVEVIDRKNVHGVDTIVYKNSRGVHFATVDWFMSNAKKVYDSASALDKAIATTDGMFASAFGEYTKGAKFKKEKFLKELAGISDAEELAKRIQTLDNELKKNLERLDEAYNVASKDYYDARNEIRSIMDAFSREAFSLYKKLDKK